MKRNTKRGFTLIELLTVIAIIGVLAGILIPTVGAAQKAMGKAKAKVTFTGWLNALQQYKAEYGYYPAVGNLQVDGTLSLSEVANVEEFVAALSGRDLEGKVVRSPLNRKGTPFYSFSQNEFDETKTDQLVDHFGNSNIYIVVDDDGNGLLDTEQFEAGAEVTEDIRATSAAYALQGNSIDGVDVFTWK